MRIFKKLQGFAIAVLGSGALAATNMISDINAYDEYMRNKKENNPNLPPPENQSQLFKNQPNFNFSLTIGTKTFRQAFF